MMRVIEKKNTQFSMQIKYDAPLKSIFALTCEFNDLMYAQLDRLICINFQTLLLNISYNSSGNLANDLQWWLHYQASKTVLLFFSTMPNNELLISL